MVTELMRRLGKGRFVLLGFLDVGFWWMALTVALLARVDNLTVTASWPALAQMATLATVIQLACGFGTRLYLGSRRLASFEEVRVTTGCVAATTLSLVVLNSIVEPQPLPRSVVLAGGAYALIASLGLRYVVRTILDRQSVSRHHRSRRTIVFGAGQAGYEVVKAILADPLSDIHPVAYLDDDRTKARLKINNLNVEGRFDHMARVAHRLSASTLLIAMPSAPRRDIIRVAKAAQEADLEVLVLPSVTARLSDNGAVSTVDIRDLALADFLERDEIRLDLDAISGYLRGKRVLVTGAGGSIGSQLCATVLQFRPERLFMLDHDENAMHRLQLALFGEVDAEADVVLADIRDEETMRHIISDLAPDVIFHAAAHKHVPYLERYPLEAVKTNVLGTLSVLRAAIDADVDRFVNVSTDKAADPVNVLGASKRLAEMLTAHVARSTGRPFMSVRFGNVLGSNGSVIPLLTEQLKEGRPMTITHPEVTRYFMTIEEAVALVVQAGALGGSGDVLVLNMGSPVRIVDLARRLASIVTPGREAEVTFVGLRPGEKLHEALLSTDDELIDAPHELLLRCRTPSVQPEGVIDVTAEIDPELIRKRLLELTNQDKR